MERDVERRKKLPAFSLGIGELEVLWNRMLALFDKSPEKLLGRIEIMLPTETLKFDNVEELKRYAQLRGRITNFKIRIYQFPGPRGISISSRSRMFVSDPTEVSASAENEAWCAGAVETVYSFLQSHKVWYHWFVSLPLGLTTLLLIYAPYVVLLFFPRETLLQNHISIPWLTIVLALSILYITKGKLLPWSTLLISEDEGFIRRNIGQLNLILMIIGIVVMVIQIVLQLAGVIH